MVATRFLARRHQLMEVVGGGADTRGGFRAARRPHLRVRPHGWILRASVSEREAAAFHFSTCIRPQRGPCVRGMSAGDADVC